MAKGGTRRITDLLQKHTPASTKVFDGFCSFSFALVAEKFEKCPK